MNHLKVRDLKRTQGAKVVSVSRPPQLQLIFTLGRSPGLRPEIEQAISD